MNSNKVTVNIKVNCDQILSLSLQVTPSSADAGVCAQQQKRVSLVRCNNTGGEMQKYLVFRLSPAVVFSLIQPEIHLCSTLTHVLYSVFLLFVFECFCDEHSDLSFQTFFIR